MMPNFLANINAHQKVNEDHVNPRIEKILNQYEADWAQLSPIVLKLTKLAEKFSIEDDNLSWPGQADYEKFK